MTLELGDPALLRTQAYIDGKWVDADDGATLDVLNPANSPLISETAPGFTGGNSERGQERHSLERGITIRRSLRDSRTGQAK